MNIVYHYDAICSRVLGDMTCLALPLQKFTGKERDTESGLDNFGARYNSYILGRFMSADPDNAGADQTDPQSWNAYAYVRDNPLNLIDPDGTIYCRPANSDEQGQGITLVCITDAQYVNSSKDQQTAYDTAGYAHYDCTCDSGADKDAYQHPNGNAGNDYVGDALVFAVSLYVVRQAEEAFFSEEQQPIPTKPTTTERATADELREAGSEVEHLSRLQGQKTADFLVNGAKTELKTLEETGPSTMKNAVETAAKQGQNIIIDARNTNYTLEQAANQVARAQGNIGGLEGRVTVLTKDGMYKF